MQQIRIRMKLTALGWPRFDNLASSDIFPAPHRLRDVSIAPIPSGGILRSDATVPVAYRRARVSCLYLSSGAPKCRRLLEVGWRGLAVLT